MIISELFDDVGDKHQKKIAIDTVKNPSKSLLGGPSPEEAEKILKDKFGMSDKQIQKLKEGTMGIGLLGDDPKEINQAGYELISKLKAPVKAEDVYSFIEQRLSDDSLADSMYLMTKEAYMDPRFKDSYGKHIKEIESIDARSILLHHLVGRDSALMYYGIGPALVGLYLAQQGVKAVAINMDMDLKGRENEPLIKEKYGVNVDVLKKEIERMWGKLPDMDQMALTQTYKAIGGTPKITAPAESIEEATPKKAVNSRGKVQKYVTAHNIKYGDKAYKEIDMELVKIDNGAQTIEFKIISPPELFGKPVRGGFKQFRRGPFMATKIPDALGEDYEKGRGPTGIAYAIKKGHPDAEDPTTGKKYPERQTPEYKKKFFKLKTNEGESMADVRTPGVDVMAQNLYNILTKMQSNGFPSLDDEAQESAEDLIGHLGEFMAKLQGDAGSFSESYGGDAGAESYLAKIDELVKMLSTKGPESKSIAYEIQNAADDIRKSMGMNPTNVRTQFENKTPGDSHYNKEKAKELAKKDGKDPEKLTYGELMSYIEKAEKMEEGHKATHVVVDPDGNVIGHASDEKGAKFTARHNLQNVKGKVFKLKKPASEKKADRMLGYKLDEPTESAELKSFKELLNQII